MKRRYSHRMTAPQRAAVTKLYAPRRTRENERSAFSHSEQCDTFFSIISDIVGGVPHPGCKCWCHGASNLFATPEPEYDLTPPPEYVNSADLAFGIESASAGPPPAMESAMPFYPELDAACGLAPEGEPDHGLDPYGFEGTIGQFPNRSRRELSSGKCDTCGDRLADCECVE